MWRIEFFTDTPNGGYWWAPTELHGEYGRFELGEVVSYTNRFPTLGEAKRVARMLHPDIRIRIVEMCSCGAMVSDVGCLNANCPK